MIRKAIIVAAGFGTRFLPATKSLPKEMLPVVDKPVIQYIVEDVVSAEIKDIVMVTSAQKRALEDHFDHSYELESLLEQGGKQELLKQVQDIAELANFIYIRQKGMNGARGTLVAIQSGYTAIGEEPFLAMWGDDFFVTDPPRCQQLVAAYEKYQAPIMGCFDATEPEHGIHYGFAEGQEVEPGIIKIEKIVEKPGHGQAPSTYATVSGFVFTPQLMSYAAKVKPMPNGEYGYTDLVQAMIDDGQPVYAAKIKGGAFYNCGNKIDYIKATIEVALQRPDMGAELKNYLKNLKI